MIGPTIPAHLLAASKSTTSEPEPGPSEPVALEAKVVSAKTLPEDEDEDEDDYVPALPPDMVAARAGVSTQEGPSVKRQIGPSFPPPQTEEDDEDEDVGPMPLPAHLFAEEKDGVQEFVEREERRRKQIEVSFCDIYMSRRIVLESKIDYCKQSGFSFLAFVPSLLRYNPGLRVCWSIVKVIIAQSFLIIICLCLGRSLEHFTELHWFRKLQNLRPPNVKNGCSFLHHHQTFLLVGPFTFCDV